MCTITVQIYAINIKDLSIQQTKYKDKLSDIFHRNDGISCHFANK